MNAILVEQRLPVMHVYGPRTAVNDEPKRRSVENGNAIRVPVGARAKERSETRFPGGPYRDAGGGLSQ